MSKNSKPKYNWRSRFRDVSNVDCAVVEVLGKMEFNDYLSDEIYKLVRECWCMERPYKTKKRYIVSEHGVLCLHPSMTENGGSIPAAHDCAVGGR